MADCIDYINGSNMTSNANNSHGANPSHDAHDAKPSNDANPSIDASTSDNVADKRSRERRAGIILAIIESLLGGVELAVGIKQGDASVKLSGVQAMYEGVGSARAIMQTRDMAEGMVEQQGYRVVTLVLRLQKHRIWKLIWTKAKGYAHSVMILYVRPCVLGVWGQFGRGGGVSRE
jgi:hypothetical protein